MTVLKVIAWTIIIAGFITIGTVYTVTVCKTCGTNYIACINESHYYSCPDGKNPSSQIGSCPTGQVCTDEQEICQPRDKGKKVCGNCETCTSGFVCRSKNQFEYCRGTTPTGMIAKCPKGQYCSIANVVKNHNICVESCLDEPTCYAEEAIKTTPAPANQEEFAKSCNGAVDSGNYENLADTSCKTFVYCETLNGNMYSVLLDCKNEFYSVKEKKCVAEKPSSCI